MADSSNPAPNTNYGLETIDLPAGAPDTSARPAQRASMLTGGIITGQSFQTDAVDPRIVIDSTGLTAHKTDGSKTISIDVATGVLTVLAGPVAGPGLAFVDSTGALIGRISIDPSSYGFNGMVIDSVQAITVISQATIGGAFAKPYAYMDVNSVGVANWDIACNDAGTGVAAISGVPGTLNFVITGGEGLILTGSGALITSIQGAGERHILNAEASFTCTFGVRWTAAAAGNGHGARTQYRQVRGNTSAGLVTPGAFTLTTVIANTNATGPAIGSVRAESAELTMTSTAAGTVVYAVGATAS